MSRFDILSQSSRWSVLLVVGVSASVGPAVRGAETESALRQMIAWQVALDRVGFSPGLVDGKAGPKTQMATREFQRVRGLPVTGELDSATAKALQVDPDKVLVRYAIQAADLEEVGPVPSSWVAKSKLKRLGHEGLQNVIAEKFHCAVHLLNTLNPGVNINGLKAGQKVVVPVVETAPVPPGVGRLEVDLEEKIIRVIDRQSRLVAVFHCSIPASKAKLPSGRAEVTGIALNPEYTFDPEMWPEVKERVGQKLSIPPGPRNPVGRCWISVSRAGVGMHGTPNPELIGKTGSHGCFRLTNWDALRLSRMVAVGTPVHFVRDRAVAMGGSK